ncbi:MAG: chromophore lyase CpcT/CpeT [Acidobacteria bacterium]|nr:chromophore lyase CpcT/CpeT [Acidobacteriota bacterium]
MRNRVCIIWRVVVPVFLCLLVPVSAGPPAPKKDAQPPTEKQKKDLRRLAEWMCGSYDSAEQAAADPENFKDIRLRMVRIWTSRTDGYWLYVEQALVAKQDQPYRQRVYHLTAEPDGALASRVFEMEDPLRFAGQWKRENPLEDLTPDQLKERPGCAIFLKVQPDGAFAGSTRGSECLSEHKGARFATSDVRITPDTLTSWDRGYDKDGKQVWGAEKGGYVFRKHTPDRPEP